MNNDLKQLISDTNDLLGSTADVPDKAAKSARAQVEASLQTVKDQIESGISTAKNKVEEQLQVLDQHVQANPYKTIGISFGVGILLGLIIGRKCGCFGKSS